jgi:malate/lactate dehydrogenase
MPTIIGRRGVEEVLNLPISKPELDAFQQSAQTLKDKLAEIS